MGRLLKYYYAAMKRHGDKKWIAAKGAIEVNPNYVVTVAQDEKGVFSTLHDNAFIVSMSDGTRFLLYLHEFGCAQDNEIISQQGEAANYNALDASYIHAAKHISQMNFNTI